MLTAFSCFSQTNNKKINLKTANHVPTTPHANIEEDVVALWKWMDATVKRVAALEAKKVGRDNTTVATALDSATIAKVVDEYFKIHPINAGKEGGNVVYNTYNVTMPKPEPKENETVVPPPSVAAKPSIFQIKLGAGVSKYASRNYDDAPREGEGVNLQIGGTLGNLQPDSGRFFLLAYGESNLSLANQDRVRHYDTLKVMDAAGHTTRVGGQLGFVIAQKHKPGGFYLSTAAGIGGIMAGFSPREITSTSFGVDANMSVRASYWRFELATTIYTTLVGGTHCKGEKPFFHDPFTGSGVDANLTFQTGHLQIGLYGNLSEFNQDLNKGFKVKSAGVMVTHWF